MATSVTLNIPNQGTRDDLRRKVVEEFLKEAPGTGKGNLTSKYVYFVETLASGNRIYLTRPAMLNKGFDFLVHVENQIFLHPRKGKTRNYTITSDSPAHFHLLDDLKNKKSHNLSDYALLYAHLQSLFRAQTVTPQQFANLIGLPGYPIEMVLGIAKWFFIEQDVTYWNFSGRQMFMDAIPTP